MSASEEREQPRYPGYGVWVLLENALGADRAVQRLVGAALVRAANREVSR